MRLELSICSEKQEKTIQDHDIKEIIGSNHLENLRAQIELTKAISAEPDSRKYYEANSEESAFRELKVR